MKGVFYTFEPTSNLKNKSLTENTSSLISGEGELEN